jgi:Cu+-exporting ATPase
VVFWCGWPLLVRGWRSLVNRSLNMFTLIALGVGAAYLASLATLAGLLPTSASGHAGHEAGGAALYFESAAVIVTLVLLGQVLELRARGKASAAIRALLDLSPKQARRIEVDGREADVPLAAVAAGDRLRVRPGERVPVDCVVVEGESAVDESMVTGESLPVARTKGEKLIGGTINGPGSLLMRAERVGSDTLLARIVALVAEAQRSKAPIQRLADRVSAWFVPAVALTAVLAFAAWMLLAPEPRLGRALTAAVSVLIIACPCALGLATPMAILVASGRAARSGLLFRNAEAIERLGEVDTLVVDKTGTLTQGKPSVVAVDALAGFEEGEVRRLAAALARASGHPLSAAVASAAPQPARATIPEGFLSVAGQGIAGRVDGRALLLGSEAWLAASSVSRPPERARAPASASAAVRPSSTWRSTAGRRRRSCSPTRSGPRRPRPSRRCAGTASGW